MRSIILLTLISLCALLAGCTHSIHLVHADGFDSPSLKNRDAFVVEAQATQDVVFYFAFDTDYVDEAKMKLEAQCPGRLSAVSTQYSTSHGFFHWTNKILMKGICG